MTQNELIESVKSTNSSNPDIDYPIVPRMHPPLYSMHKYWARKPHNVVCKYISRYSKEGDIVLDPFSGSGVTVIEALRLGRKAIGIDLNPISTFITRCSIIPIDIEKFEEDFDLVLNNVKEEYGELYQTICPNCGKESTLLGVAWNNDTPFEKVIECPDCGRKRFEISQIDLDLIDQIQEMEIKYWYPEDVELPPEKKENLDYVHELFTRRNLIILSSLLNQIEKIRNKNRREILKFVFTSALAQTTKMMPYVHESAGKIAKGWTTHSYYAPPQHYELNVFEYFRLRFNEIKRGKEESNKYFSGLKEAKNFDDLSNGADYYLKTASVLELINETFPKKTIVKENSIDYIFTDPPYGGTIQYFELSVLWASWLKFPIIFDDEITENKYQNKDFERYERMIKQAFRQMFRTLKSDSYLTVTFHSKLIKYRNSLIKSVVFAGFDMKKIVYQPPAVVSAQAQRQPYGSAIGDYYIRFKKPVSEKVKTENEIDEIRFERVIVDTVKKLLAERGQPTPYSYLLNYIDVELEKNGLLLGAKTDIKDVLKKYLDKEFVLVEGQNGLIKGKNWWFKNPNEISYLDRIPLNERVEKAVIDVLKSGDKVSFDDVLQKIYEKFPNSLTPETYSVNSYLDAYAIKEPGGKWRINPDFKANENLHQTMIKYLVEIGVKLGYKVWAAHKNEEILKITEKELRLPLDRLERVKEIDVLWIKNSMIEYEFEVENTTQITEAIVRGTNIPYSIKRYIVIPEKRESLLKSKFNEPLLQERIKKENWMIIPYIDLSKFYERNIKKSKLALQNFERIARINISSVEKQQTLSNF